MPKTRSRQTDFVKLRDKMKKDPSSYIEELQRSHERFKTLMELHSRNPETYGKEAAQLSSFLSQVIQSYPTELADFPMNLLKFMTKNARSLSSKARLQIAKVLINVRKKGFFRPIVLLEALMDLFQYRDKKVSSFIEKYIKSDIKSLSGSDKNILVKQIALKYLKEEEGTFTEEASRAALKIITSLYQKFLINDSAALAVLTNACFFPESRVRIIALRCFLNSEKIKMEDSESEEEENATSNAKEIALANKVNKKSRKRAKKLQKAKRSANKRKKDTNVGPHSALFVINNPQGFADRLLKSAMNRSEQFETKLMVIELVSRLISYHKLILDNFYSQLQSYIRPHQSDVTRILQFIAEASHDLVPPDYIEPVLRAIVCNFVAERNSADVIATGLNAIREICRRCPLAMTKELMECIVEFKDHKEKGVFMAIRSVINMFREVYPEILQKKDKGRPTVAQAEREPTGKYGEQRAQEYVYGIEVMMEDDKSDQSDYDLGEDSDIDDGIDEGWDTLSETEIENGRRQPQGSIEEKKMKPTEMSLEAKKEAAKELSCSKILTDEDFAKIDKEPKMRASRFAKKESAKRSLEQSDSSDSEGDRVKLTSIENVHKKRKHDREARLETVMRGREGREKFGSRRGRSNPNASKTEKEKKKKKNFQMVKHKIKKVKKRSFQTRKNALQRSLLKKKKH